MQPKRVGKNITQNTKIILADTLGNVFFGIQKKHNLKLLPYSNPWSQYGPNWLKEETTKNHKKYRKYTQKE